jgi:hypothetical protein
VAPVVVDALALLDGWTDSTTLDRFGAHGTILDYMAAQGFIERLI